MDKELLSVINAGNCSGCGACVLTGHATGMRLDIKGDLRPQADSPARTEIPLADYCPGIRVERPAGSEPIDPFFGSHRGVWRGNATDEALRHRASSGGAISALVATALASESATVVFAARGSASATTSLAEAVTEVDLISNYASSRYAPVSILAAAANRRSDVERKTALVCRPCEASALRALFSNPNTRPLIVSFFCAGVPHQSATDQLVEELGIPLDQVESVKYRGNGWPGRFTVKTKSGVVRSMSYQESWGEFLGRNLQERCKFCVDGVGESADVAVGDFWESDEEGFPIFSEAPGESVIIARTERGEDLVESAAKSGFLTITPSKISALHQVQPFQVSRRRFLAARLLGRRAARRRVPKYRGFGLFPMAIRHPRAAIRQARGSYRRARNEHSAA